MKYSLSLLSIIFLVLCFNKTKAQNNISLELSYAKAARSFSWNRFNTLNANSNDIGILINIPLDKKGHHSITTGYVLNMFSFSDSFTVYDEPNTQIIYTKVSFNYLHSVVPLYYYFSLKGIYIQGGMNRRIFNTSWLYYGDRLVGRDIIESLSFWEYHLGLGYKYEFTNLGVRVGLSAETNTERTYYDYGIDLSIYYVFNKKNNMKYTFIALFIFLFINFSVNAQKGSKPIQLIGLKCDYGLNFKNGRWIGSTYGIDLNYNRSFKNEKHYWVTGLGVQLSILPSQVEVDTFQWGGNTPQLHDHGLYFSVPTQYMYKPISWLYIKTGFNHHFTFRNTTIDTSPGIDYREKGIPSYRRYILDAHAGIGSEISIKRFKIRFEAYLNYPFLTDEYLEKGVSMGFFYQFARKNR